MEPIVRKRIEVFKDPQRRVGATVTPQGVQARVWAPDTKEVQLQWIDGVTTLLEKDKDGYFNGLFPEAKAGDRYAFIVDGQTMPDPASRYQPHDVKGPSEVVADDFAWSDQNWRGVPYDQWVMYELHTGTFSERGDFQGIIDDLPRLKELGVNVLEVMPVSQYPGNRNWGYDGVFPFAVQNSYGGPQELKKLVDACHAHGLAIVLDVVYNHMGPEGNTLPVFGPYFQSKYKTPWGDALNFDGPMSEHVRNYFLQSAWQWLTEYHFDGLRLDAIHTILDVSPIPFLEELTRIKTFAEKERGFPLIIIGETDRNDSRMLAPADLNGLGLDAQWADDLHHVLHVLITGETGSYYVDYGGIEQLARTYRNGVSFEGEYSFSRGRCHGRSYAGIDRKRLVVQTQNHDQIGNRINGRRLNSIIDFHKIKLNAAAIFLSPCTPLFFMGEELAVENPFHYFVSHSDQELLDLIRNGRNEEFNLTMEEIDPASEDLYHQSIFPDRASCTSDTGKLTNQLFRDLIAHSKRLRQLECAVDLDAGQQQIILKYGSENDLNLVILSFSDEQTTYALPEAGAWQYIFRTEDYQPGFAPRSGEKAETTILIPPFSAVVLARETS